MLVRLRDYRSPILQLRREALAQVFKAGSSHFSGRIETDQCKAFGPRPRRACSLLCTSHHYQLFSSPEFALNPNLTKLKIQPVNFPFRSVIASDNCEYHWPNFEIERLEALQSMRRRTELLVALSAADLKPR